MKNLSNSRSPDGLVYMVPADNIGMQVNISFSEGAHLFKSLMIASCTKSRSISSINANDRRAGAVLTYVENVVGHVPRKISKIF